MTGKQLKNSILQWAIQGKLVPQDPNDEPASVLLERIRAEKAQLIKEGKIKKDKNESIIYRGDDNSYYEKMLATGEVKCIDEEIPFDIPQGWEWTRLSRIVYNHGQKAPDEVFSYIDIGSIDNVNQKLNSKETILNANEAPSRARRIIRFGDIIYSTVRPYLHNTCIIDRTFLKPAIASTGFAVFACHRGLINKYLFNYLLTPQFDAYANDKNNAKGVAYPAINDEKLYKALVPVPPTNEQNRIINIIEQLSPYVSRYSEAASVLKSLNTQLGESLKRSVLQQAIQGKLVLQTAEDGTAQELLEQIKKEKQKLVKEGKLKKADSATSIIFKGDDNKYYEQVGDETIEIPSDVVFPEEWAILRLSYVCRLIDGEKMTGLYPCLDAKFLRGKASPTMHESGRFVKHGDNIILVDGENSGEVFMVTHDGYMGSTFKQLWISSRMYAPYVLDFILFYKDQLRNSKKGAAIPHLNKDYFYNLLIGIPPIQEQIAIHNCIEELFQKLS